MTALFYPDVANVNWSSTQDLTNFLSQLVTSGFAGVVHKVTQGADYQDPYWSECQQWCTSNELPYLGYHYLDTSDPTAQAQNWVNSGGGLNAMFDVEDGSGDIDNVWAVTNAFNAVGVNVQLWYLPQWYWNSIGIPDLSQLVSNNIMLVSSSYPGGTGYASTIYANSGGDTGEGWASYGGATPSAWQFTDSATIAGFTVDCNAYLGSDIGVLFGSTAAPAPPAPSPSSVPTYMWLPVDDSIYAAIGAIASQFIGAA
jgi:GH25 family lysozyme M1 (1,4-beta-N-acetylmuramidase)